MRKQRSTRAAGIAALALVFAMFLQGAPAAVADSPAGSFTFGAAGDFGYSSNAQATFSAAGAAGLEFFLALGDTTYSDTSESTWCSAFRAQVPNVLVLAGNHDTGEDAGANLNNLLSACPYGLNETLSGRYGREWYFDYPGSAPLARFILSGCGTSFNVDGESKWTCARNDSHYNFVADAIDGARAAEIPWVIVATHKNCITMGAKSCEIGTDFFSLLLDKRVDLILQGHDHVYERTKQLQCAAVNAFNASCAVDDGADGLYTKGEGAVLMVSGMGGRPKYPFDTSEAEAGYFAAAFNETWGFASFTVNSTALQFAFVRSAGANDSDSFTIEAPVPPQPPPPPPPPRPPPWIPGLPAVEAPLVLAALAVAAIGAVAGRSRIHARR